MHAVQSVFLLLTFFITHHVESTSYFDTDRDGRIEASWFANQVLSSNDFYPFSAAANFVFGGFNNHVAHHLFPQTASVHYPRLSRMLYRILEDEQGLIPNQTGYLDGAVSHLRHLRKMGRRPLNKCSELKDISRTKRTVLHSD
jgi:linoleoyl-CoA desaturase